MSLYDREAVKPLWEELSAVGMEPLTTAEEVDRALQSSKGTTLVMVNSVCGCAAGSARPGVALALQHERIPDRMYTVFAGVDMEATARAREYMKGIPPSSPSVALFADGQLVFVLPRTDIEGRYPQAIAEALMAVFDRTCERTGPSVPPETFKQVFGGYQVPCGSSFRIKS